MATNGFFRQSNKKAIKLNNLMNFLMLYSIKGSLQKVYPDNIFSKLSFKTMLVMCVEQVLFVVIQNTHRPFYARILSSIINNNKQSLQPNVE